MKRGQIQLGVFHIVGSSIASLNEIADIAPFVVDGKYYLVKNFINETSFFDWDQATYDSYFKKVKDAVDITIPKLNEMAYEQVELASVPFVTFIANKGPKRRRRQLLLRAARLCAALARQCVGGIRSREAARARGDRGHPGERRQIRPIARLPSERAAAIHGQTRGGQS